VRVTKVAAAPGIIVLRGRACAVERADDPLHSSRIANLAAIFRMPSVRPNVFR
jgi:hypothetical protein